MRSHYCGQVTEDLLGQEVVLCGWVHRRRDHGGVIFIDLRDREGLVQIVFKPDSSPACHERAGQLRSEYVVMIRGIVAPRSDDTVNPKLPTGEVEIIAEEVRLLSRATPPPFGIETEIDADESTRLRYRIHDLRRPPLQRALRLRHELSQRVRGALVVADFLEIETPMLTKSTPEGARDFLVPSRLQPGEFYALPQSPQIFKQILMMSGCDRYIQICRCLRDEDPRADRQAEFTQVDLEMSFVTRDDILELMTGFIQTLWQEIAGVDVGEMPILPYAEAMDRYGSDKPDLRFGVELQVLRARRRHLEAAEQAAHATGHVPVVTFRTPEKQAGPVGIATRSRIDDLSGCDGGNLDHPRALTNL